MFESVLFTVGLEHEASWRKALRVALDMAGAPDARLHVMTVVPEVAVPALCSTARSITRRS